MLCNCTACRNIENGIDDSFLNLLEERLTKKIGKSSTLLTMASVKLPGSLSRNLVEIVLELLQVNPSFEKDLQDVLEHSTPQGKLTRTKQPIPPRKDFNQVANFLLPTQYNYLVLRALEFIRDNEEITTRMFATEADIEMKEAGLVLRYLAGEGKVRQWGQRRGQYYTLAEDGENESSYTDTVSVTE